MGFFSDMEALLDSDAGRIYHLDDRAELEAFFADLAGYACGTYLGIEFLLDDALDGSPLNRERRDIKMYVRVAFPRSLGADMLLEARPGTHPGTGDALDTHFTWSATNGEYLRTIVCGPLLDALVALARNHSQVMVTDEWVAFGDIHGTPAQQAGYLDQLVRAILDRWPKDSDDDVGAWDGPPVALGQSGSEQPFFCYFCGATFAREVALCPACGAHLDEE